MGESIWSSNSLGNGELSWLEVGGSLGGSESLEGSLVLVEASSGGLGGVLPSEVSWGVLLALELSLGGLSSLLVDDGESLGNGLSNNL